MNRITRSVTTIMAALLSTTLTAQAEGLDEIQDFNIEAQPLDAALIEFSEQAGLQVVVPTELVAGLQSPGINGEVSATTALASLLDDNDLTFQPIGDDTVALSKTGEGKTRGKSRPAASQVLMAQNRTSAQRTRTSNLTETMTEDDEDPIPLEEIVVTGSHIRGARSASPVYEYSRQDIDQTGVSTLPQFMRRLPQNFGGGLTETTDNVVPQPGQLGNINTGNGVNLRGLGNDSTLVLLNGRRLAPAGAGDFVDISMIPLTAIERVEVLTDGASAIYGSEAIGGVVNFKLREDYDGAETRLRYSTAPSGGLDDIQLGQTFGTTWADGYALVSYEYQSRDELKSADRDFSIDAEGEGILVLLPSQERHSVFLAAGQSLSDAVDVFGDAFYSKRDSKSSNIVRTLLRNVLRHTEQYGASLGARVALNDNWQTEIVGSFSQNDVAGERIILETVDVLELDSRTWKTWTMDGKVDGALFAVPGGDVKVAIGGQYRREKFDGFQPSTSQDLSAARTVYALFGEMHAPLVGEENRIAGVERLELTVAGRYEDYSDFGSSTDSKFGLLWSPSEGINFRGTWGTSFRAPLFGELENDASAVGFLRFLPNPDSPTGSTLAVLARGGNADLQPETATTWTAGFDFRPSSIQGLDFNVTYFNVNFENRISVVRCSATCFTDPRFAPLLDFNPDPDFLAFFGAKEFSRNSAPGFEFTDAEVVVDGRRRNNARSEIDGFDFTVAYTWNGDIGSLGFRLGGTYMFQQLEQLIETDEPFDVVGTTFNLPDLKLRGSVNWGIERFVTNLAINYVDGSRNERVDPAEPVSSWTTVDLSISYSTGDHLDSAWLDNTAISLSALNLFDRDPPFVTSYFDRNKINYDPTNASPVGRTVALQITKQW